jgi:hypothetical protein
MAVSMVPLPVIAVPGDDDDLGTVGLVAELSQDLEPVEVRHDDVEQRHIKGFGAQRLDGRAAVATGGDVVALP